MLGDVSWTNAFEIMPVIAPVTPEVSEPDSQVVRLISCVGFILEHGTAIGGEGHGLGGGPCLAIVASAISWAVLCCPCGQGSAPVWVQLPARKAGQNSTFFLLRACLPVGWPPAAAASAAAAALAAALSDFFSALLLPLPLPLPLPFVGQPLDQ